MYFCEHVGLQQGSCAEPQVELPVITGRGPIAAVQHSGASVWSRNGSRVTPWVRWANAMRGVFFGNVKSSPPIQVLSCRFRTVKGSLATARCQNRTCFFPSCAAPRFEWWLTSLHRSGTTGWNTIFRHTFYRTALSLWTSFQQRRAITTYPMNTTACFRTTSSFSRTDGLELFSAMAITVVISEVLHSCAIDTVSM